MIHFAIRSFQVSPLAAAVRRERPQFNELV